MKIRSILKKLLHNIGLMIPSILSPMSVRAGGDWTLGMVADKVVVPKGTKPGRYVLSWRMDCEETAQIW
eukprot:COSAG04_NODE_544_length_12827_cov_262.923421_5_plen_69_part_00